LYRAAGRGGHRRPRFTTAHVWQPWRAVAASARLLLKLRPKQVCVVAPGARASHHLLTNRQPIIIIIMIIIIIIMMIIIMIT